MPATGSERPRVVIAGWAGAGNLGDELLLAALRRRLDRLGASGVAVSLDPAGTRTLHGVDAVARWDAPALGRALAGARLFLFGPGGIVQDETSWASLPSHTWRVELARRARVPVAGYGLGVGPVHTRVGRALVHRALGGASAVVVRDDDSARWTAACGIGPVTVTADLAWSLEPPVVDPVDRIVVCLRPYSGRGRVLPSRVRDRRDRQVAARPAALAAALDELSRRLDLPVHFVAFERGRDDGLHERVASRMRRPATAAAPDLDGVLAEVAGSRLVVATRYHAGVAALLGGRPAVLVGYSPKVRALAATTGRATVAVTDDRAGYAAIPRAASRVLGRDADAVAVAAEHRAREQRNEEVLAALVG